MTTLTNRPLVYVYCIVERTDKRRERLEAADSFPRSVGFGKAREIPLRDIAAIVSDVSNAKFSQSAVDSGLKDSSWLAETAARHEAAVEHIMQYESAVIPMKLCTIFKSVARVTAMLKERYLAFKRSLRLVRGNLEFGITAYAGIAGLIDEVRNGAGRFSQNKRLMKLREKLLSAKPGAAYFLKQELDEVVTKAAQQELSALSRGILQEMKRGSVAWTTSNPIIQIGEVGRLAKSDSPNKAKLRQTRPMILNSSYLVKRGRADRFRAVFEKVQRKYSAKGVELKMSGPWPPYKFT